MSRKVEKGHNNPFCIARMRAARSNDRLASRFGASEMVAISEKRLSLIENGLTNPYPEEVLMMSSIYNAPELENYYCSTICPLRAVPAIEKDKSLSEIAISAYSALKVAEELQEEIIDIAKDGQITYDEKLRVERVLDSLDLVVKTKEELATLVKRTAGGEYYGEKKD